MLIRLYSHENNNNNNNNIHAWPPSTLNPGSGFIAPIVFPLSN